MADSFSIPKSVDMATFNMHGFIQGAAMVLELSLSFDVIFCQEHWLSTDQLFRLSDLVDGFRCVSVSAMDDVCSKGVLRGRPFGGLAIFVRESLCSSLVCLVKSERVLAVKIGGCIFICVYFPVSNSSAEYASMISNVISVMEDIAVQNMHCPIIIGGDFNLEFVNGFTRCHGLNDFIVSNNMHRCKSAAGTMYTFCAENRNAQSFIDHFLVNDCLIDSVHDCYAVESGVNFSDRLPLALHCSSLPLHTWHTPGCTVHKPTTTHKTKRYRWDKADLLSYYYATDSYLCNIDMSSISELCQCSVGCRCDISVCIDNVYQGIVEALHASSRDHCPVTTDNFFKPYWDEEMSELKRQSIDTQVMGILWSTIEWFYL